MGPEEPPAGPLTLLPPACTTFTLRKHRSLVATGGAALQETPYRVFVSLLTRPAR